MSDKNLVSDFVEKILQDILASESLKLNYSDNELFNVDNFKSNCGMIIIHNFLEIITESLYDNSEYIYEILEDPEKNSGDYEVLSEATEKSFKYFINRLFKTEDFNCAVFTVNQDQDVFVDIMNYLVIHINKNMKKIINMYSYRYTDDVALDIEKKHEFININTDNEIRVFFITLKF